MSNKTRICVRDIMNDKYSIVDGRLTVQEALTIMRQKDAACLIIRKRNDGDEYGIVLPADIAKKVLAKDRSSDRVNIYEIMTKPIISVSPGMDVRYCARLFDRFGLTLAPVIEGDQVLGVISYQDIVLKGISCSP
jgi:predicted transcriptional regulator